jgi:hypothetical protein
MGAKALVDLRGARTNAGGAAHRVEISHLSLQSDVVRRIACPAPHGSNIVALAHLFKMFQRGF